MNEDEDDAEIARILAMTDEETEEYLRQEGITPEEVDEVIDQAIAISEARFATKH